MWTQRMKAVWNTARVCIIEQFKSHKRHYNSSIVYKRLLFRKSNDICNKLPHDDTYSYVFLNLQIITLRFSKHATITFLLSHSPDPLGMCELFIFIKLVHYVFKITRSILELKRPKPTMNRFHYYVLNVVPSPPSATNCSRYWTMILMSCYILTVCTTQVVCVHHYSPACSWFKWCVYTDNLIERHFFWIWTDNELQTSTNNIQTGALWVLSGQWVINA